MYAKTTKDFADLIKKYNFTKYFVINGWWEGKVIELTDEYFIINNAVQNIKYPIGDYDFDINFNIVEEGREFKRLGDFTLDELKTICEQCCKHDICVKENSFDCELNRFMKQLFKVPLVFVNLDKEFEIY